MANVIERDSRKIVQRLKKDGWVLDRVNGSHHIFVHPNVGNPVVVVHPKKDLPKGTAARIHKDAGWK